MGTDRPVIRAHLCPSVVVELKLEKATQPRQVSQSYVWLLRRLN